MGFTPRRGGVLARSDAACRSLRHRARRSDAGSPQLVRDDLRRLLGVLQRAREDPRRPADQDRRQSRGAALRRRHLRGGTGDGAVALRRTTAAAAALARRARVLGRRWTTRSNRTCGPRSRRRRTRRAALRHDHEPLHAGHHRALVEARTRDSGTSCTSRSRTRRSAARTRRASAEPSFPHYRFDKAALIVGLEADFLGTWLSPVEFTAQYARRRRAGAIDGAPRAVRIGAVAHGRERRRAPRRRTVGDRPPRAGAARSRAVGRSRTDPARSPRLPVPTPELDALAERLRQHRGESLVVCGVQDVAVQIVVARLNHVLGNIGRTLELVALLVAETGRRRGGRDARRGDAARRRSTRSSSTASIQPTTIRTRRRSCAASSAWRSACRSPTASTKRRRTCTRSVPDHHYLEAWGDAEPVSGSFSLIQPTIAPLFETRAAQDSLLKWLGRSAGLSRAISVPTGSGHLYPRQTGERDFDAFWDRTLQAGFLQVGRAVGRRRRRSPAISRPPSAASATSTARAVGRRPDRVRAPRLRDGRACGTAATRTIPWLQELPDPITKLTWGHGLAIAPAVADRLGVQRRRRRRGDQRRGPRRAARLAAAGSVADDGVDCAAATDGPHAGRVGNGVGVNASRFLRHAGDGLRRIHPTVVALREDGTVRAARRDADASLDGRAPARSRSDARRNFSRMPAPAARRRRLAAFALGRARARQPHVGPDHRSQLRAPAARRASSPARPRTTCRSSGRTRSDAAARCTGSAIDRYYQGVGRRRPTSSFSR